MEFLRRLDNDGAGAGYTESTIDENFNFRMDTATLPAKLMEIEKNSEAFQTALSNLSGFFGNAANLWKSADATMLSASVPGPIAEMNKRKQEIDNLTKVARELRKVIDEGQGNLSENVKAALSKIDGGAV